MIRFETTLGSFTVELFAKEAPITSQNFLDYVDAGHFDAVSVFVGMGITVGLRLAAIQWGLTLPVFRLSDRNGHLSR